jgi:predicted secreted Zn-dependent protease
MSTQLEALERLVSTVTTKELEDIIDAMRCCGNCKHMKSDCKCLIQQSFMQPHFICDEWKFDWRTTVARKKGIDQFKGEKE